jgi:hydrogenase maturation protein HypF
MMKSSFSFLYRQNLYISQYLGDLEHFDAQENYRQTLNHFKKVFQVQAEILLCDLHPDYPSTHLAKAMAAELNAPYYEVQHHLAHFAAILGEHNLVKIKDPVLGIIWDGTGLGNDGQIWGGEFFLFQQGQFVRYVHLEYFDFILGNKMPKEPRISAFALAHAIPEAKDLLREKFTEREWKIYNNIITKDHLLKCSSMGRLFDAVASLLNICDVQSYEGEAAMQLEAMAFSYFKRYSLDFPEGYKIKIEQGKISSQFLIAQLILDLQNDQDRNYIAAKFHYSLVLMIQKVARASNTKKLAFSGGVFQNGVLVDLILHHLEKDFELYIHQQLSPNDENISFGQIIYYQIQQDLGK